MVFLLLLYIRIFLDVKDSGAESTYLCWGHHMQSTVTVGVPMEKEKQALKPERLKGKEDNNLHSFVRICSRK